MNYPSRRIAAGSRTSRLEFVELIQWLFLAELLTPSIEVWLVAPKIDDAPLLDNADGKFDMLDPTWGCRAVRLRELIIRMASAGTRVSMATLATSVAPLFLDELRAAVRDHGLEARVRIEACPWLKSPGILNSHGVLRGSFEMSTGLVTLADDVLTFETDPEMIAAARPGFAANWTQAD